MEQVPDGTDYRIGGRLVTLAAGVRPARGLVALVRPHLVELAGALGEAAGLSIPDGSLVHYVDQEDSPHPVGIRDWTGTRLADARRLVGPGHARPHARAGRRADPGRTARAVHARDRDGPRAGPRTGPARAAGRLRVDARRGCRGDHARSPRPWPTGTARSSGRSTSTARPTASRTRAVVPLCATGSRRTWWPRPPAPRRLSARPVSRAGARRARLRRARAHRTRRTQRTAAPAPRG